MSINKIILLLLLLGGGFFWWNQNNQKKRYELQVSSLASNLDRKWFAQETSESEVTAQYMKALLTIHGYRELVAAGKVKKPVEEYLKEAITKAGSPSSEETDLLAQSYLESLSLCERGKILSTDSEMRTMNEGRLPVLQAGTYKGEKLNLLRKVPVQLARSAMNHPANLTLVPDSVYAQIWPYTANDYTLRTAGQFNMIQLIESGEYMDVKKRNDQFRNVSFR